MDKRHAKRVALTLAASNIHISIGTGSILCDIDNIEDAERVEAALRELVGEMLSRAGVDGLPGSIDEAIMATSR